MNEASEGFLYLFGGFCFWGGDPKTTEGYKRKLTTVLSADMEGYSGLMREDEEATVHTLTTYRTAMTRSKFIHMVMVFVNLRILIPHKAFERRREQ